MLVELKIALLFAALSLPRPWYHPDDPEAETKEDYEARVEVIVEAIVLEAERVKSSWTTTQLAYAALTKMYGESVLHVDVHSGKKLGDEGRAICLGQHHRNGRSEDRWRSLAGTDLESTRRCARATLVTLAGAANYCRAPATVEGATRMFALYGSGSSCKPRKASSRKRALRWYRLLQQYPPRPPRDVVSSRDSSSEDAADR